jgi:hypothetical protein
LAPGINISIGSSWRAPYNYWSFIPRNYIQYSNPHRYVVRNNYNTNIVNNITIINNYNSYDNKDYYHRGPDYREVEQYTRKTISPIAIAPARRPGVERINQRQFEIYRPAVTPNSAANNRSPIPARIRTINEVTANGEIRRSRAETGNNGGNSYPSTGGNFRNRPLNSGVNGGNNNADNTTGNAANAIGNSSTDDRIQRIERFRQNYPQNNTAAPQAPDQQQTQKTMGERSETPPIRRYRPMQSNQQSNIDRGAATSQQADEMRERFRNERRERIEQFRGNNQNGGYNQNPSPGFPNNRNIERPQNVPQQNNPFRVQPNMQPGDQRAIPARPPVSERNTQLPGLPNVPQRPTRRAE